MKRVFLMTLLLCLLPMALSASESVNYDDPNVSKEVNTLRKFRDYHLKKYAAGRAFIRYYYKYGPVAAEAIKKRERLKSLIRLCLLPLMYAGKNFDGVTLALKTFALFLIVVLIDYVYLTIKAPPARNRRVNIVY